MEDERDAEDAIRALDRSEFGRKSRRLRVEWTKQERSISRWPESSRKSSSNSRPSKTLFVINFDPYHTRTRDLERHFDPYGKIMNVRIRRNFAFIQYETEEDATKALDATNLSKMLGRVITVEYASKDDDERRTGHGSSGRTRDRSPRKGHDRVRSRSPNRGERDSPDYGRGRARRPSPYRRERASPNYAPGSNQGPSRNDRDSEYSRELSPSTRKERGDGYHRERASPDYVQSGQTPSREGKDSEHSRDLSPSTRKERNSGFNHKHSPSSQRERSNGDMDHGPNSTSSPSPQRKQREGDMSPDDYGRVKIPVYSDAESPPPE